MTQALPVGDTPVADSGPGTGVVPQPLNVLQTLLSQYANSPVLLAILTQFTEALTRLVDFERFYELIWNVDTAQGYGLDVWGRIVGVNRVLDLGLGPRYFGFQEGLPDYDPFNVSPFYDGEALTQNYALSDDGFRVLILAKAYSNICDGSSSSINRLLKMLFGSSGRCYVVDNLDMSFVYKFEFTLTPLQRAILVQSGVMPRPTGVSVTIVEN